MEMNSSLNNTKYNINQGNPEKQHFGAKAVRLKGYPFILMDFIYSRTVIELPVIALSASNFLH